MTVVLVTHFMEEAERLCDRVAVIEAGRVAAIGSPAGLPAASVASSGSTSSPPGRWTAGCWPVCPK